MKSLGPWEAGLRVSLCKEERWDARGGGGQGGPLIRFFFEFDRWQDLFVNMLVPESR